MPELETIALQDENSVCRDVVGVLRYEISIFKMLGLSGSELSSYIFEHGGELRSSYCSDCVYRSSCRVKS